MRPLLYGGLALLTCLFTMDLWASHVWWPPYFRRSFPLFRKTVSIPSLVTVYPLAGKLSELFIKQGNQGIAVEFKAIDDRTIAFTSVDPDPFYLWLMPVFPFWTFHGAIRIASESTSASLVVFSDFWSLGWTVGLVTLSVMHSPAWLFALILWGLWKCIAYASIIHHIVLRINSEAALVQRRASN
jgi:hypothetical protein